MKIKVNDCKHVATIKFEKNDVLDYGTCPECKNNLVKSVFEFIESPSDYWGRLECENCGWVSFPEGLESVELDPVKSYLENERNQLNRKISKLKKVSLHRN